MSSDSSVESVDVCRNCSSAFQPGQRFCGACGQKTGVTRLTMREIAHDIAHALTHADHSIFALVRSLVTRPGDVAREYVDGKRKRHFGPWAFLVITVGLASAVILISGVNWFKPFAQDRVADVLGRHINLVILLQMPVLAGACALLYWRERLNYAEHLVFAAYTSGFRALFLAVIETPLLAIFEADTADPRLATMYYGVWFAYFAFAASQFYRGNRLWSAAKAIFAAILSQAFIVAILMGLVYLMGRFTGPAQASTAPGQACDIDPAAGATPPESALEVRTGMSMHELVDILGTPDYSPTGGQYYFSDIEGECNVGDSGGRTAPCGLIVEFRSPYEGDMRPLKRWDRVQSCGWGAIPE